MAMILKRAACDHTCGFMIQSTSDDEIIKFFKLHFEKTHGMILGDEDIKIKIRKVQNGGFTQQREGVRTN